MPGPEPMPSPEPMPQPEPMPGPEPMPAPEPMPGPEPMPEPAPDPTRPDGAAAACQPSGSELEAVRRMWPDVLEYVKSQRKVTFFRCQDARVLSLQDGVLTLGFPIPGNLKAFATGDHRALVEHALVQVIGVQARVDAVPAPGSAGEAPARHTAAPADAWSPSTDDSGSASGSSEPWQPPEPPAREETSARQAPPEPTAQTNGAARVRQAMQQTPPADGNHGGGNQAEPSEAERPPAPIAPEDDVPDRDDPDAEDSGLVGATVVEQILGGRVITVEENER